MKNIAKMKVQSIYKGNTCLFLVFMFFNFLLFLSSLGIFGCAVYLFVLTKNANVFNLCFLTIAVFLLVFSLAAFKMRRSIHLLGMYIFVLLIVFFFQSIITVLIFLLKNVVINWAQSNMQDSQ
jgi:hypothetical protein